MNTAFVWVGTFDNDREFKKYANHSAAKCPFRVDYPMSCSGSYIETFRAPNESLRNAMERLYYSAGYLDAVLEQLKGKKGASSLNAVKVIYAPNRLAKKIDTTNWLAVKAPLRFLGAFEYGTNVPLRHPNLKDGKALEQKGWASVWIGTTADKSSADSYMEEVYKKNGPEDQPLSRFGRDWKLSYDHDFLFHESHSVPQSVDKLLNGWTGGKLFAKPATAAAKAAGISTGTLVVVAYDLDYSVAPPFYTLDGAGYSRNKGKPNAKSPLTFVGAFRYANK
ncbi:MAG: immunity 22 family protein [Planctomycetaceae bacterium]